MKINRIAQLIAAIAFAANISSIGFAAGQHAQGRYQPIQAQIETSNATKAGTGYRQYSQNVQHDKARANATAQDVQTVDAPVRVYRQQSEAVQHQKGTHSKGSKADKMVATTPVASSSETAAELLEQIDALFGDFSQTI